MIFFKLLWLKSSKNIWKSSRTSFPVIILLLDYSDLCTLKNPFFLYIFFRKKNIFFLIKKISPSIKNRLSNTMDNFWKKIFIKKYFSFASKIFFFAQKLFLFLQREDK